MNFFPEYLPKEIELILASGSIYVLRTPTNNFWKHAVIKQLKIKKPRISLTFRLL